MIGEKIHAGYRRFDKMSNNQRALLVGGGAFALMAVVMPSILILPERHDDSRTPDFLDWYDESVSSGDLLLTHFNPGESGALEQNSLPSDADGVWKRTVDGQNDGNSGPVRIEPEVRVMTIDDLDSDTPIDCADGILGTDFVGVTLLGLDIAAYQGDFGSVRVDVSEYGGHVAICATGGTSVTVRAANNS